MSISTCSETTEAAPSTVRVVVVDDHEQYRSLVGTVIGAASGFELVGEAASQAEVVALLERSDQLPDLVLLDVNLGDESGLDVSQVILSIAPAAEILLISTMAVDELPPGAPGCGARGYLSKSQVSPSALSAAWAGAYDW